VLRRTALVVALFATTSSSVFAVGHNVPITSNLSPYLHLTRNEFLLNDSFPVYHKLVRPKVDSRQVGMRSTLSPYLHLKRKDVSPWFPFYQQVVRPVLQRRSTSEALRLSASPPRARQLPAHRRSARISPAPNPYPAPRLPTTGIVRQSEVAIDHQRLVPTTGVRAWSGASWAPSTVPAGRL
jgi:hypothetical protein